MEKDNDTMFIEIYEWVDSIPLSRVKKNISRDFSDAGKLNLLSPPCRNYQKLYTKYRRDA
jgi:hypothetical protein